MTRGRRLTLAGVGLLFALAVSGAEPPKTGGLPLLPRTDNAPPPLPNIPSPIHGVTPLPIPADLPRSAAPLPPPDFPKLLVPLAPAKPPEPEPQITEPVATVHRFKGKYLGGDGFRALVYVETGDGKAEVQSRPLADAIPPADAKAKDDVKRIEVPAGEATYHAGRVFLTTTRELLVIDGECHTDWRFTLPGKADNGEKLLGVAGFYSGCVVVASQHEDNPGNGPNVKRTGRTLTFDIATGRQVGFATIKDGFDPNAKMSLDAPNGVLFAVGDSRYTVYQLASGAERWTAPIAPRAKNVTASNGIVFATADWCVGMPGRGANGFETLADYATGTAPARFVATANGTGRAFVPLQNTDGQNALAHYKVRAGGSTVEWWARVPNEITTLPMVRGQSVYFLTCSAVGSATVYRVNAVDGAICWKHTLAMNVGETLTDLAFVGNELRASGPGVLVRVAERAAPPVPQLFGPGVGVFPSR